MNIIYIHGLNSGRQATKALQLIDYVKANHPNIQVHNPDLNLPPQQVVDKLTALIEQLSATSPVVLIGSSLGGYFSTLLSNQTGMPVFLLNPSVRPHLSLCRFFAVDEQVGIDLSQIGQVVGHVTAGGWSIRGQDLVWFDEHKLEGIANPDKVKALLKTGDELLDYRLAEEFYSRHGASVEVQTGGDHRMTDFAEQLPAIMDWILNGWG